MDLETMNSQEKQIAVMKNRKKRNAGTHRFTWFDIRVQCISTSTGANTNPLWNQWEEYKSSLFSIRDTVFSRLTLIAITSRNPNTAYNVAYIGQNTEWDITPEHPHLSVNYIQVPTISKLPRGTPENFSRGSTTNPGQQAVALKNSCLDHSRARFSASQQKVAF